MLSYPCLWRLKACTTHLGKHPTHGSTTRTPYCHFDHHLFPSGHAGREHVLSVIRQNYWIINARVLTRQILRSCITCRKRNEAGMKQMMGDLPKARLPHSSPPLPTPGWISLVLSTLNVVVAQKMCMVAQQEQSISRMIGP